MEDKLKRFTDIFMRYSYAAAMSVILIIIMFFVNITYKHKKYIPVSNLEIFALLILLLLILFIIMRLLNKNGINSECVNFGKCVNIITIFLLLMQIYTARNIFFATGWDVAPVVESSRLYALGYGERIMDTYAFSSYQNNLLIVIIQSAVLWLNSRVGIFTGEMELMSLILVNCIINTCTCLLIYKTGRLFVDEKYAFMGFVAGVAAVGISPWTIICYSDSLALIFPVLSLYLYARPYKTEIMKYTGILFAMINACIGYYIKPQCLIIMIAIAIAELLQSCSKDHWRTLIKKSVIILSVLIFLIGFGKVRDTILYNEGVVIDENQKIGMTHFFMMGLNEETNGAYNASDIAFSRSFPDVKSRNEANMREAVSRIKEKKIGGLIEHTLKKTLTVWNDGTYAWGEEGGFYEELYSEPNRYAAHILRNIFYTTGRYYKYFATFEQCVWIAILVLAIFATHSKKSSVLMLSIFGLIVFEMLFEARARYLYIYVPILCILAAVGLCRVMELLNKAECLVRRRI